MTLNEYQVLAMRYRLPTAGHLYALMGLSGEVGELHSYVAKSYRDDYDYDVDHIKKELGDILWFVAAIADDLSIDLKDLATTNLNKLESRQARNAIKGNGDNR